MRLKRAVNSELVGMTTLTEQEYLERYGRSGYAGSGELVDLGCWLGSTTIPLAKGLDANRKFAGSGHKIFAYDLFIWFEWMNASAAGTDLRGRFREGDSFVDEFRKRIEPFSSVVEVREGDLKSIGWSGQPIEYLVVDAMKDWDLANAITRDFYPHLIAGDGLVVQQDFGHYFTPWIHLIHWRMRDYFEFVEEVPRSSTVVLRCIKPVPSDLCAQALAYETFGNDEVKAAIRHSLSLVSTSMAPNIAAAEVMWFVHQHRLAEAERAFQDHLSDGIELTGDMLKVSKILTNNSRPGN